MSEEQDKTSEKVERDENGRIKPGQESLNPTGRPKGSISIKDAIRKKLTENPERFDELIEFYMKEEAPAMRKLLWEMLEGKPKESVDMEVTLPKPIMDVDE